VPLDPLDPRHFALSPEQRAADKFANLDRRLSGQERSSLNKIARNRLHDAEPSEVSTTLGSPTDLGGPAITVEVPAGAFVAVYAQVEIKMTGTAANVMLYEPTDLPGGVFIIDDDGTAYVRKATTPASGGGATAPGITGQLIFVPTPGVRTYSLRYYANPGAGGSTGFFRNRELWVEVF